MRRLMRSAERDDTSRSSSPPGSTARPSVRGRSDLALVRRALRGSRGAEDELSLRLECLPRMLRAILRRFGGGMAEADFQDLVQDTALAIWRKLELFDGRSALETWAYRFCSLQLLEKLRAIDRARSRRSELEVDPGLEPPSGVVASIDLEAALGLLEPDEERVVRLKHYDGITFEAMGARLGLSTNTVKTRYYRGLMKLRDHLRGRHPDLFGKVER